MAPTPPHTAGSSSKFAGESLPPAPPPLQAVWLADMTAEKFLPITLERPKVLLPLVNKPIVDYTLEWLQSTGVGHLFMVCRSHTDQIRAYLADSYWVSQPKFTVSVIDSVHDTATAGDALRLIDSLNVIHRDFVLVSGDIVGNISLSEALQEHKDRRKKDNFSIMSMVIQESTSDYLAHESWYGIDELYMDVDPNTKQLLYYEKRVHYRQRTSSSQRKSLACNRSESWHNNMQDCYIDVCSPEVLSLFTHNNYQHLRHDFVEALLGDNIRQHKIFTYEIKSSYAFRADNYRSYASISKEIIERRRYPIVHNAKNSCELMHLLHTESEIRKSHSPQDYDPYSVIGKGSSVGNNPKIVSSVIGENCVIGSDVSIDSCYIWDNVTIENGCKLTESLLCDGIVLKSGAVLNPGVVLSFNVVVGEKFVVPAYSKLLLFQEPVKQESDKELPCLTVSSSLHVSGGDGHIWSVWKRSVEEWRNSVASLPEDLYKYLDPDSDIEDYGYRDDSDTGSADEECVVFDDDEDEDSGADIEAYEKEKMLAYPGQELKKQKL